MRRRNCFRLKKKPDRPGLESGGTCKFPGLPPLTGCAHSSDARRTALDREYLDGRGAPAQLYWSQRLNNKIAAGVREAERVGGDEQRTAGLLAIFLQPCSDVHRVAEIGDLPARVPALAYPHRSRMRPCAEIRDQAEFPPVCIRILRNPVLDCKKAIEATSLRPLGSEPPGDDDLVPDIGVHFAAMGKDCLVDVIDEPRQKLMPAQFTHRLRQRGRADEIEEQQHPLLPRRPSIPSNNYIEEHAAADQACQFEERADHN